LPRADIVVDDDVLLRYPLPDPASTNKDERGTVVVVGSSRETIGATLLAATAALRAGAGKLRMVVDDQVADATAVAMPEARVVGVPLAVNLLDASTFDGSAELFFDADAVLVGPGTVDGEHGRALAATVAPHLGPRTAFAAQPSAMLDELVNRLAVCVALRDATTWIGTPDGQRFVDRAGHPALATSGSGDVLAGMLAGLAARGAATLVAVLWAVHTHGLVGEGLVRKFGGIGLLARDLLDCIPHVLNRLGPTAQSATG